MPVPPAVAAERARGVYVYVWKPGSRIEFDTYRDLRKSIQENIAAHALSLGHGHRSQGHAMIRFKRYQGLKQKFTGKTTAQMISDAELLWVQTLITDETPSGGVKALMQADATAEYQSKSDLKGELDDPQGTLTRWYFDATPAQAAAGVAWINGSRKSNAAKPRGRRWGFDQGCTNWVHGALAAAGILAGPRDGYRNVFVHKRYWLNSGEDLLAIEPWQAAQTADYQHKVEFLTPKLFIELLKAKGFTRIN